MRTLAPSTGRHSTASTSRSRAVRAGGGCNVAVVRSPGSAGASNVRVDTPTPMRSPSRSAYAPKMRRPFTQVPFVLPASVSTHVGPARSQTRWSREADGSSTARSLLAA